MINTEYLSDRTRVHIWNRLQDLIWWEADYKIGNLYYMNDHHKTFGVENFWALFVGNSSWRLFLPTEKEELETYRVLAGIPRKSALVESSRLNVYPEGYINRMHLTVGEEKSAEGLL